MAGMDSEYFNVLQQNLNGQKAPDTQTNVCLAVLDDRLQRLKRLGKQFEDIDFSPAVKKISRQNAALAVGSH